MRHESSKNITKCLENEGLYLAVRKVLIVNLKIMAEQAESMCPILKAISGVGVA